MRSVILTGLLTCAIAAMGWAADSGGYRGPQRNGTHPATGLLKAWPEAGPQLKWTWPSNPETVWQEETGVGMGYSCPNVVGDTVYVTGIRYDKGEKNLYALALSLEGKPIWEQQLTRGLGCGRFEGPRGTPEVRDGRLYVFSGHSVISCLDARNGRILWQVDLRKVYQDKVPGWGFNLSPLLLDDKLIIPIRRGKHTMVAISAETGEHLWGNQESEWAYTDSSPVVVRMNGRNVVLCSLHSAILAVDPDDGKIVWKQEGKGQFGTSLTPSVHGDTVFVHTRKQLRKWKAKEDDFGFDEKWAVKGIDALGQIVVTGDRLFAVRGRHLVCLSTETGEEIHRQPFEWVIRSLIGADGMVYVIESNNKAPGNGKGLYREQGRISLVKPTRDGFDVTGTVLPPRGTKEVYVAPTIAAGMLLHRHGHLLAAYDIRDPKAAVGAGR